MTEPWGPAQIKFLAKMAADARQYSARRIAEVMELEFGISYTRNMVIGKCKRMGIALQNQKYTRINGSKLRHGGGPQKLTRASWGIGGHGKPKPPTPLPLPTAESIAPMPLHLSLFDLKLQSCRWPYGDKDFTFCGHHKSASGPYCEYHGSLAWNRNTNRTVNTGTTKS